MHAGHFFQRLKLPKLKIFSFPKCRCFCGLNPKQRRESDSEVWRFRTLLNAPSWDSYMVCKCCVSFWLRNVVWEETVSYLESTRKSNICSHNHLTNRCRLDIFRYIGRIKTLSRDWIIFFYACRGSFLMYRLKKPVRILTLSGIWSQTRFKADQ